MSLRINKDQEPQIAKEDIKVWKLYRQTNKSYLYSYYQEVRTYFGVQEKVEFGIAANLYNEEYSVIEEGYHSFINLIAAKTFYYSRNPFSGLKIVLVKCTIPKGSLYYEGIFGNYNINSGREYKCYASNELIVEQIIPVSPK